jgi:hypothetical protein
MWSYSLATFGAKELDDSSRCRGGQVERKHHRNGPAEGVTPIDGILNKTQIKMSKTI